MMPITFGSVKVVMLALSGGSYDDMEMSSESKPSENDMILDVLRRPEPFYDVEYLSQLGGIDFKRLQLADFVLNLLINTAEFRDKAMSYRGFNVGAGAMALHGNRVGRVLGFNAKFDDTDRVNIHAEDLVTAKATDAGFDAISVLAVIGPTQEDHASGKCTPTLHPCGRCRGRLAMSPLVKDDTLVVTATPDFTSIELGSLGDIQNAHQDDTQSTMRLFRYDATPEVFSPIPEPDERGYARVVEVDDKDWQSSVGRWLMARYIAKQSDL